MTPQEPKGVLPPRNPLGPFLSFLSGINPLLLLGLVELWASAACPSACGQLVGLSIRCGKSISPEKNVSYYTKRYIGVFNI
jgi:hypothetical protein